MHEARNHVLGRPHTVRNHATNTLLVSLIVVNGVLALRLLEARHASLSTKTHWDRVVNAARPLKARTEGGRPTYPLVILAGGSLDREGILALEGAGSACSSCSFLLTEHVEGAEALRDSHIGDRTFLAAALGNEGSSVGSVEALGAEAWLVVDRKGQTRSRGILGNYGIEAAVGTMSRTRVPLTADLVATELRALAAASNALQPYAELATTSRSQTHSVLFVSRASASCWTGLVVARVFNPRTRGWHSTGPSLGVSAEWSAEELVAFRATFRIDGRAIVVAPELQALWKSWQRRYGVGAIPMFLAAFTPSGLHRVVLGQDLLTFDVKGIAP